MQFIIDLWCNGSTADFGSVSLGPNPSKSSYILLKMKTNEEKIELVNKCTNENELMQAVLECAEENSIQGMSRPFDAKKMSGYVHSVISGKLPSNLLTRNFGIREKAIQLKELKLNV